MKGIQVSLTAKERECLLDAVSYYIDMMGDGDEKSVSIINKALNDGLGSALYKLYKGLRGEGYYKKYEKSKK